MQDDIADLYHVAYRRLVAQVFAFTTDLGEAQDAVQEAFARAIARRNTLRDVDAPEAWLRTVAINIVRRRWRRRRLFDTILLRERPLTKLVQEAPEPDRADLREALEKLPRPFREVIVLHYLADLPVDEVASLLEVPVGTVKSRLSRGREALKGMLDDVEAPPISQVNKRAQQIRSRRATAKAAALVLALGSAVLLAPWPSGAPPQRPATPQVSVPPSYFGQGVTVIGIFDPAGVPDLIGTITDLDLDSHGQGWLRTPAQYATTADGGLEWTVVADPGAAGPTAPWTWQSRRDPSLRTSGAKLERNGVTWTAPQSDVDALAVTAGGEYVLGLQGRRLRYVYRASGAGMELVTGVAQEIYVMGEPILWARNGTLLVADSQGRWMLSQDQGRTWADAATKGSNLPLVGSLHATSSGYVALDLFHSGWVAVSDDGQTWRKLPIR